MDKQSTTRSAIIYQSPSQSIFILDIPRSIELAQQLQQSPQTQQQESQPQSQHERHLVSCPALEYPYTAPSEPKTSAARQRVLERISVSEQRFHASIVPEVERALKHVQQQRHAGPWCFERWCIQTPPHRYLSYSTDDDDIHPHYKAFLWRWRNSTRSHSDNSIPNACAEPPIILAPGINCFPSLSSVQGSIVRNALPDAVALQITSPRAIYTIPPQSTFLCTHLASTLTSPDGSTPKFNLLVLDPPWPNRSVRRSSQYQTAPTLQTLRPLLEEIISNHLYSEHDCAAPSQSSTGTASRAGIVGIWTTNASNALNAVFDVFCNSQLTVCEEWIWVKCAANGEPVLPVKGIWRKPYEVIIWGRKQNSPTKKKRKRKDDGDGDGVIRRVIFAVPDIHSRKPNLKELVERVFLRATEGGVHEGDVCEYRAMEVFARHLTAGWWACGDEVLKFNSEKWWEDQG